MFCDQCGKKLTDGARFCDACGAAMAYAPLETPQETAQPMDAAESVASCAEEAVMEVAPEQAEFVPMPVEETFVQPVQEPVWQPTFEPMPQAYVPPLEYEESPIEPVCKPEKRRKPSIGLRIPMQLLSFLLCLVLMVSMLATVALADLNRLTSAGGIKQLINAVLLPNSAPVMVRPVGAAGVSGVEEWPEDMPELDLGDLDLEDVELPPDIFTSENPTDALVNWILEMVQENTEEELPVTAEQIKAVVEKSTVTDFVAEKVASYAEDYINGTANTTITAQEIMDLIEENEELLKEELNIELTPEDKQQLNQAVEEMVEEAELDRVIREEVFASVDQAIEESSGGMDREQIMLLVQTLTATRTLLLAIGLCLLIMLLLCATNFYNLPGALTWISVAGMFMGLIVAMPIALLQFAPKFILNFVPGLDGLMPMVSSSMGVLAPIHYGLFGFGLLMMIGSIVWRSVRKSRRKQKLEAVA